MRDQLSSDSSGALTVAPERTPRRTPDAAMKYLFVNAARRRP